MGHNEARGYGHAHARVRQARGPAREHMCPCGVRAAQWAYDHNDPNPRTATVLSPPRGTAVVTWSDDPSHYIAMCHRCHAGFDLQHGNRKNIGLAYREELAANPASRTGTFCHLVAAFMANPDARHHA